MKLSLTPLVILLLATTLPAQETPRSNIDRTAMDPSCKPCQDFWRYANGGWIDKNPIPARYASWGHMSMLREANRDRLRTILEGLAKNAPTAKANSNDRKLGEMYASCMDTATIDARGIKPLQADLDRVAAIQSTKDLVAALTELNRTLSIGPFGLADMPDLKNSKAVIAAIAVGGLSLPDRDYYFKDDARSKLIREELLKHVSKMFQLLGEKPEVASAAANTIMAFETELARASLTRVARRDPYAWYHVMGLAELAALTPHYDWKPMFRQFKLDLNAPINVTQPEFLKQFDRQLATVPLQDWKTWLRWRVLEDAAANLSKPFVDQAFYFNSTVLSGVKEQLPRWQTCTTLVDRSMGEALGEIFVAKHFPPEAKRRMNTLVENLRVTLRGQLETADFLSPDTKKNAVAKLNAFTTKIGYPEKWLSYAELQVDGKTYFENVRAAELFQRLDGLAKIGKPVDRALWHMTPPTVNAYYNPPMNEIVFPAGILQAPFFDLKADDAVNYGAIGAVIGHEMGHGFDDQGSKFNSEGNLKDWWTAEDLKKFQARTACVVDQFNTLDVGEGLRHNGKLVVGEALGDLGGLKLAYNAYQRSLGGKPGPVIDDFTADQRFFLSFARAWSTHYTPESLRLMLNTNPHPVPKFRANGTLQNMPEFHKAFQCKDGDPMMRPADKQCKLW